MAALGVAAIWLACAGCTSIGPGTVARDRLDYSVAVGDSWKSQMLLNLVKIRYADAPVFLEVGQIVAGYSFPRSFGAAAAVNQTDGTPVITSSAGLSAGATFNDSPTVTYAPMSGERFARSLMTPIPPAVLLNIIQAGNPVEEVFRTSVQSVNGIDNRRVGRLFVRRANPEFYALLPSLERLQSSGDIGMRLQQGEGEPKLQMIFRPRTAAAEESALRHVAQLLGLDSSAREYQVIYGTVASHDREIALLTRSIYEILVDIASYISVPEAHVAEKRVRPTAEGDIGPSGAIPPLIRIGSSAEPPVDPFVAVPYQGYWFYIDNRDIPSKQIFSSIMFLFTFVETRSNEAAPILTIPTTR
ncbi:hypothetical protein [Pseudomonas linyingensis]|uniref:hypothetical protein n=1 Tax=Pseudomonas linyingensis TaxID=915471 RepID=UPI000B7F95CC|nr:hypothetical protein [Pseudomonas linyingensis]